MSTENEITEMLAAKHENDIFVPQCKNGPTHAADQLRIFDAWAMKRSWANRETIGYEIKTSRSDFLGDDKWHDYLRDCHRFYWVCPFGLIQPGEIDSGLAGLIWVTKSGNGLRTVRKAPRRDVGWPSDLMAYVLMSRASICRTEDQWRKEGVEYWRDWLAAKQESRSIGSRVRGRMRAEYTAAVERAESAARMVERYEGFKKTLRENGIDPDACTKWSFESKLEQLRGDIPRSIDHALGMAKRSIERLQGEIDEIRGES